MGVLLHLGSVGSGGFVGSDVLLSDGVSSLIWEGLDEGNSLNIMVSSDAGSVSGSYKHSDGAK